MLCTLKKEAVHQATRRHVSLHSRHRGNIVSCISADMVVVTCFWEVVVCQWVVMIPWDRYQCLYQWVVIIPCDRHTVPWDRYQCLYQYQQWYHADRHTLPANGHYKFRTVTFLFFEFSFCVHKSYITTFCIYFVTVIHSLEKVLQDTRKVKIKCGSHFNKPRPSCGGTVHLFSNYCTIHRWVVRVTLYPNPYSDRMAGWVGRWANVQAVVKRKMSAGAGYWMLPLRYSSLHSICVSYTADRLY
jgi:hypothetical protein